MKSVKIPFAEIDQIEDTKVNLNQLNPVFFNIIDYTWAKQYSVEDIEPYLKLEIVHVIFSVDHNGKYEGKVHVHDGLHTCVKNDFQKSDFDKNFYQTYVEDRNAKFICFN